MTRFRCNNRRPAVDHQGGAKLCSVPLCRLSGGTIKVPRTTDSLAVASLTRVSIAKVSIARVSVAVVSVTCPFSRNTLVRRSKGQSEVRFRMRLRWPH